MAYPSRIYAKAHHILEERRSDAELQARLRTAEIMEAVPEMEQIQQGLSRVGCELSMLLFYRDDKQKKVDELHQRSKALTQKREALLRANGYDAAAMEPQYICPVCHDTGFLDGKLCACHRELLKALTRDEIRRVAPIDDCTFDSFRLDKYSDKPNEKGIVPRERAAKIFDAAQRYAHRFSRDSKSLLFLGGTGLGKTHLSLAIAGEVIDRGYYVCYGTSQNICDDLQTELFRRDARTTYTKDSVLECDLLILDDLGTEVNNQYTIAAVQNIINSRLLAKKPTLISTNYDWHVLEQRYDKRITSRLTDSSYVAMQFFGTDIRSTR